MSKYKVYLNIACLYMANTLPMYFATLAIPTILRAQGIALSIIGLFGSLMLPWAFKFLWAPLLDKYYSPRFGKRKSWFIPTQIAIILMLCNIFLIAPDKHPQLLFTALVLLLICSATHYLASSAYIAEQLPNNQLRFGNYAQVVGTALGSFIGGGMFLIIYAKFGWQISISYIVTVSCLALLIPLFMREKAYSEDILLQQSPSLRSFILRPNTRYLLYICLVYRGCEGLVMGMQQSFLIDRHVAILTIGKVMGTSGLSLSLLASGLVSLYLANKENKWLLILGGIRSLCYLGLAVLAYFTVTQVNYLLSLVVINMACRSMEMVVLYTFFMKNCDRKQVATDISILLCAEIIVYSLGTMSSGYLAEQLGYTGLFALGTILSIIATIICAYLLHKVILLNKVQACDV